MDEIVCSMVKTIKDKYGEYDAMPLDKRVDLFKFAEHIEEYNSKLFNKVMDLFGYRHWGENI